jgi:phytoene synthase
MNDIYAFCRYTDDIVDNLNEPDEVKFEKLRKWRIELEKALQFRSSSPLLNKVSKSIQKFNIPLEPFFDLIRGMEMDLQHKRYFSFNDLQTYCYRVASTVGLMCIEIFGYKNQCVKDYAVNLGMALQLTNILRDVKTDAENGRIYLPKEDMGRFNYSEKELMDNVYNDNFVLLMRYEAEKAKKYFEEADKNLRFEDKPSLYAARAMQHIYFKLLTKLEAKNFNVFENKIKVSKFDKVYLALGVWIKYKLVY